MKPTSTTENFTEPFLSDVLRGLSQPQKSLPCKYLYDERGSYLFDQICQTDEYYPTRTELAIMERYSESISDQIDQSVMLVEFGSGSSLKSRVLLDALRSPVAYVPVDISEEYLLKTAVELQSLYPAMEILPVVADFTRPFELPCSHKPASHVALYFPGSTIGNYSRAQAGRLLKSMSDMLGIGGGLLIGIDLQKDVSIIEAAYNDTQGLTAEFNLNLLCRINAELAADFDIDQFEHQAVYNSDEQRMEISIVSRAHQQTRVGNQLFDFAPGEKILTEYSHKYTIEGFSTFASQFGFALHEYWTDNQKFFGVLHLVLER